MNTTAAADSTKPEAHGLIFDNLNPNTRTVRSLRAATALNALIHRSLGFSDSWGLTNGVLHEMLLAPDGAEFLKAGIIVPMVRADIPDFRARYIQVRDKPGSLHGFHDNEAFVTLVDLHGKKSTYDPAGVGANYRRLSDLVLSPESLMLAGFSALAIETIQRLYGAADSKVKYTNTFLKDVIEPALPESERELFWGIVRAVYALNLPTLYGLGIAATSEFSGHEVLRKILRQGAKPVGELIVGQSTVGDYSSKINDRLVSWLLSPDLLVTITATEIAQALSHHSYPTMSAALKVFEKDSSLANWMTLSGALENYFKSVSSELFNARVAQEKIKSDPTTTDETKLIGSDHQVTVQVDDTIPLTLSDMPATHPDDLVQLVGRTRFFPVVPSDKP